MSYHEETRELPAESSSQPAGDVSHKPDGRLPLLSARPEIMQGTLPGVRRRGRLRMAWMYNIKTWTRLSVEESIRMTEDRDKWRKYVHGVADHRIEDG